MWAGAVYVFVGAIVTFGAWHFACAGRRNGSARWAVAAGVLWPVMPFGVAEVAVIFAVVALMRRAFDSRHVIDEPRQPRLDEEECVLA